MSEQNVQRTLWMFPRNKRKAAPTELGIILRSLSTALAHSEHSSLDQNAQDEWMKTAQEFGLKSGGAFQHTASGGARTYLAYLKQMGLLFQKRSQIKGVKPTYLTLAGQKLADLENPAKVIRHQVLSIQFPSPYSNGSQVRICPTVKVRPAVFVCEMLMSGKLGNGLSDEDVAIACIYGRSHRELDLVIEKCLQARMSFQSSSLADKQTRRIEALRSVIDAPRSDFYTNKTDTENTDYAWQAKRIEEILNIANTLVNRMKSAGLLTEDFVNESVFSSSLATLNKQHLNQINQVRNTPIEDGRNHVDEDSWQRRLGRYEAAKDNRQDVTCQAYDLKSPAETFKHDILSQYHRFGTLFDKAEFCRDFDRRTGIGYEKAFEILESVLPEAEEDLERELLLASADDKRHGDFEKIISYLLRRKFPECYVEHIGPKVRADKSETNHNYADILIRDPDRRHVFIDAKATKGGKAYSFPAHDQTKSQDYVKYPGELLANPELDELVAFLIVAPQFSEGAYNKAAKCAERTNTPFKLMAVRDFQHKMQNDKTSFDTFLNALSG